MTTKTIQKWGNSLAMRLPQKTARKFGLREGSRVFVWEKEEGIVIQKAKTWRKTQKRNGWERFLIRTRKQKEPVSKHIDNILYGAHS